MSPVEALTDAEIAADIATLKRQMSDWNIEGRLDSDTEADLIDEIEALQEELSIREQDRAPAGGGGFNADLFTFLMGATPEEVFG